MARNMNEADTRVKLIDPRLHDSGWEENMIRRGKVIAPGRIIDEDGNRRKGTEIDYILEISDFPVAVVEAKEEKKSAKTGMQQAKDDAKNYMEVLFAYSTNGHTERIRVCGEGYQGRCQTARPV